MAGLRGAEELEWVGVSDGGLESRMRDMGSSAGNRFFFFLEKGCGLIHSQERQRVFHLALLLSHPSGLCR